MPKLIHADELSKIKSSRELPGTHIVSRGLNIVYGPSESYKSFYVLGQALTIAQSTPVVYIAAEGSSGLNDRVQAWRKHHDRESGQLFFIPEEVNLLDYAKVSSVIEDVKAKIKSPPAVVIVDTYARCMIGGDENSAKDTGLVIYNCAQLQRALGCAMLLVHHTGKGNGGERGSSALRGAADIMIEILNTGKQITVECTKAKDRPHWPTEAFRFFPAGKSGVLLPADEVPEMIELSRPEVAILELLSLEFFDKGATTKQIEGGTGISERSLYRALSTLKRNCHVCQSKKGQPVAITDLGRAVFRGQIPLGLSIDKVLENLELD